MKVVILSGGFGSRIIEETKFIPKPMIAIGSHPILWHLMKYYSTFGFNEFIIALGYKGDVIGRYFLGDDWNTKSNKTPVAQWKEWTIHLVDTGERTSTGGRIKRLESYLKNQTFMLTYGDGLSDIDLKELLRFHHSHGKLATVTAVRPPARYGHLILNDSQVIRFKEKPKNTKDWINGGFFVLEPGVLEYINEDDNQWEGKPLENLSKDGQLMAYKHHSFWDSVDTLSDKKRIEKLWLQNRAPWRAW